MLRKLLVCAPLAAALGCLLMGCSDDTSRITSSEATDVPTSISTLSTGTDWPPDQSLEDYTYPDDETTIEDDQWSYGQDEPINPPTDVNVSNKPIDNEKEPD